MKSLLHPKELVIKDDENTSGKTYYLSKYPALAGREIFLRYFSTVLPKIGGYQANAETMKKLMCYVFVELNNGHKIPLDTDNLIDNHVDNWEYLIKIEKASLEHNFSFFQQGKSLDSLKEYLDKHRQLILSTLTALSGLLSQAEKQP